MRNFAGRVWKWVRKLRQSMGDGGAN